MKVKVKLFATLAKTVAERYRKDLARSCLRSGDLFEVELPEASTLIELLDHLKLDRKEAAILFVNGKIQELNHKLVAGDQVGVFPPVGGG